jgi:hypothetical protein
MSKPCGRRLSRLCMSSSGALPISGRLVHGGPRLLGSLDPVDRSGLDMQEMSLSGRESRHEPANLECVQLELRPQPRPRRIGTSAHTNANVTVTPIGRRSYVPSACASVCLGCGGLGSTWPASPTRPASAAAALRAAISTPVPTVVRAKRDELAISLHAAPGAEAVVTALAAGRAMPLEQAVALRTRGCARQRHASTRGGCGASLMGARC